MPSRILQPHARTDFLLELEEIPAEVAEASQARLSQLSEQPDGRRGAREYLERVIAACRKHDLLLPTTSLLRDHVRSATSPRRSRDSGAMDVGSSFIR